MNKLFKRAMALVLSASLVAGLAVVAAPAKAQASELACEVEANAVVTENKEVVALNGASNPHFAAEKMYSIWYPSDNAKYYKTKIAIYGATSKDKITNLSSSNKEITPSIYKSGSNVYLELKFPKKATNAKITCKVNGKALTLKFYVYKYANPFKNLQFGKTEVKSAFNAKETGAISKAFSNQKFILRCNTNWKVTEISYYIQGKNKRFKYDSVDKLCIPKLSVNKKSKSYIFIYAYNAKTGVHNSWYLYNR